MEQATQHRPAGRRTTAEALKQQVLAVLAEVLPAGWISQPLAGGEGNPTSAGEAGAGDILIISPRGHCHFLFVRAPADRWWDGGPRSVAAEVFSARDAALARQLRAAGHRARAIWNEKDLARALRAWGCPLQRPVALARNRPQPAAAAARGAKPQRSRLHLGGIGRRTDA
ncbi:hypothetical protein [Pelagibius sp. 7325]|uniref:hypothetical protein n=1 Tax=Pelagibius sp. 7325 TaxID=3131994 RepID=UPI0030EC3227